MLEMLNGNVRNIPQDCRNTEYYLKTVTKNITAQPSSNLVKYMVRNQIFIHDAPEEGHEVVVVAYRESKRRNTALGS